MRKKAGKKKKEKTNNIYSEDKQKYIKELLNFKEDDEDENKNVEGDSEDEDISNLEKNVENIILDQQKATETDGESSLTENDSEDIEKTEEINKEFLDTKEINDYITKKGKFMKNAMLGYIDLRGNLNNNNNPFIKSSKEIDINKNTISDNNEDEPKIKNNYEINKNDSESEQYDKFSNKPPKTFDTNNAKELKNELIELSEEDKEGNEKNFW